MKSPACRFVTWALAATLSAASLASLDSVQAAEFADEFDPSAVLATPAPQTVEVLAFDMNRVVTQQMRLIRYEASAHQRKVAEARARAYVAAQRRAAPQPKATAKAPAPTPKKTTKPKAGEPATAKKTKEAQPATTTKSAEPKPLPRYIAVDTVKDKRAAPDARKVVMIWDTQADALVGNNIYDVKNPPAVGSNSKFETYSAQYIGAGL